MKPFYKSKINWLMVCLLLIAVLQIAQEWYAKGDFSVPGCITLAIAILTVFVRTWFTDEPIKTPKAERKLAAIMQDDPCAEIVTSNRPGGVG